MAQIIASTKEISNKRESLIVLSNSKIVLSKFRIFEMSVLSCFTYFSFAAPSHIELRLFPKVSKSEILFFKELLNTISDSLLLDISKMRNLLKTILEFILILEKIIAIYNKAEKKNEATAVS